MLIFSYVGEEGSTKCLCKQKKEITEKSEIASNKTGTSK